MFPGAEDFAIRQETIAVVGLGYIGLPLAVLLAQKYHVVGFDINPRRVKELENHLDRTGEVSAAELARSGICFLSIPEELANARLIIVAVPTPVDSFHIPDLESLKAAVRTVGEHISAGTTVVFESTVYPGVTEDICIPILEEKSGLACGQGFRVAYSPERMNPGDREHTLATTTKVISAQDPETLQLLTGVYGSVIGSIYPAPFIKVAEAAKVIENIQRDLNIALINELAIIFQQLKIDFGEVLAAAATKWNFIRFEPGLVGGHCIGVDPYYLTYRCEAIDYHPQLILAGRRINNQMGKYVAEQTVKCLIAASTQVNGAKVLILGFTYKENVKDVRNTRIIDIYKELAEYGISTFIYDPQVIPDEVEIEYNIKLIGDIGDEAPYNAIILAVKHQALGMLSLPFMRKLCSDNPVLVDVKAVHSREEAEGSGFYYWRL